MVGFLNTLDIEKERRLSRPLVGYLRWRAAMLPHLDLQSSSIRSILLVELTHLGDFLSALPAVAAIRCSFPHARVRLLVRAQHQELAAMAVAGIAVTGIDGLPSLAAVARSIKYGRSYTCDIACSLGPGRLNGLTVLLSGSPRMAGYLECIPEKAPFLRQNRLDAFGLPSPVDVVYGDEPLATRAGKVCRLLGIGETKDPFPLSLPEKVKKWHSRAMHLSDVPGDARPLVVMHPFAGWKHRALPPATLLQVVRRLLDVSDGNVVLIGGRGDAAALESMRCGLNAGTRVATVASTDLVATAVIVQRAACFVGTDSGPLHLAAALGVPVIGLYGPAEPRLTRPFSESDALFTGLYHRLECSPCSQKNCIRPEDSCMHMITVDETVHAVMTRLALPRREGALPRA